MLTMFLFLLLVSIQYTMQVTYANVIQPLAELEAHQFPLVQSCLFPKLVSPSGDVRKASAEAERKIASHQSICR